MTAAIGIDVGGTKIAGGLVELPGGRSTAHLLLPTSPQRGGQAVLDDVLKMAVSLRAPAHAAGTRAACVGLGVAELVDRSGEVMSAATIPWQGLPIRRLISEALSLPVWLEADVRAAAAAEASFGRGKGSECFLYITVGTGISACLVMGGDPFLGARGLTGTFASGRHLFSDDGGELRQGQPLEEFASGPAIARRYAAARPGFAGSARDVLEMARRGDSLARLITQSSGHALGAAIAQLINTLDPELVVLGGGLGVAEGCFRQSVDEAMREYLWSEHHRDIPLVPSGLDNDAGWIGAAVVAARRVSATEPC